MERQNHNPHHAGTDQESGHRGKAASSGKEFLSESIANLILVAAFISLLGLIAYNQYSISTLTTQPLLPQTDPANTVADRHNGAGAAPHTGRMAFSPFDNKRAHAMMDADKDGMCDVCGMPVDACTKMGMMTCDMGAMGGKTDGSAKQGAQQGAQGASQGAGEKKGIGLLGSQHIHADWKVFINGKQINLTPLSGRHESQMMGDKTINDTSAFMHIHPTEGKTAVGGDVLHMHATGVPLQLFLESIGMNLSQDCFTAPSGERHCTDLTDTTKGNGTSATPNTLKFLVNGKPNNEFGQYVFSPGDKILISYGPRDEDLTPQLSAITSVAAIHEAHHNGSTSGAGTGSQSGDAGHDQEDGHAAGGC